MMNISIVTGYLANKPSLNKTKQGVYVTNFSLAVPRRYRINGHRPTDFIRCSIFGRNALHFVRTNIKRELISVSGRLEQGQYRDKQTGRSYDDYEINVSDYTPLDVLASNDVKTKVNSIKDSLSSSASDSSASESSLSTSASSSESSSASEKSTFKDLF